MDESTARTDDGLLRYETGPSRGRGAPVGKHGSETIRSYLKVKVFLSKREGVRHNAP